MNNFRIILKAIKPKGVNFVKNIIEEIIRLSELTPKLYKNSRLIHFEGFEEEWVNSKNH